MLHYTETEVLLRRCKFIIRRGGHMRALTRRPWGSSNTETTWELRPGDHMGASGLKKCLRNCEFMQVTCYIDRVCL